MEKHEKLKQTTTSDGKLQLVQFAVRWFEEMIKRSKN